eukprot:21432-Pyramimonas_sp.AAC.1
MSEGSRRRVTLNAPRLDGPSTAAAAAPVPGAGHRPAAAWPTEKEALRVAPWARIGARPLSSRTAGGSAAQLRCTAASDNLAQLRCSARCSAAQLRCSAA